MLAVTVEAGGHMLPLMLIFKGAANCWIASHKIGIFPDGRHYTCKKSVDRQGDDAQVDWSCAHPLEEKQGARDCFHPSTWCISHWHDGNNCSQNPIPWDWIPPYSWWLHIFVLACWCQYEQNYQSVECNKNGSIGCWRARGPSMVRQTSQCKACCRVGCISLLKCATTDGEKCKDEKRIRVVLSQCSYISLLVYFNIVMIKFVYYINHYTDWTLVIILNNCISVATVVVKKPPHGVILVVREASLHDF